MRDETRQFTVRLPVSVLKRVQRLVERRRKETGIRSLSRADVVRALIEQAVTLAEKKGL